MMLPVVLSGLLGCPSQPTQSDTHVGLDSGEAAHAPVVCCGDNYSCAVGSRASIECWEEWPGTQNTIVVPDGRPYSQVACGTHHALALDETLEAIFWADSSASHTPEPPDGPWAMIDAGAGFSCGIHQEGRLECWGSQIGNGGWEIPSMVGGEYLQVSTGSTLMCAVNAAFGLECWGIQDGETHDYGQVSDVPAGTFQQVSAGFAHACALDSQGYITCWGRPDFGRLDAPEGEYLYVGAGSRHSCALNAQGQATCWGLDDPEDPYDGGQVKGTPSGDGFVQLSVGSRHNCAVHSDRSVVCWGGNESGACDVPEDL